MKQPKPAYSFRMNAVDRERLRVVAKQKNLKPTQLIRKLVERFLDQESIEVSKSA